MLQRRINSMKLQDKRNSDCYIEVLLNSFKNLQSSPSQIFCKMVFFVISQNSQENMCVTVFFDNVVGLPIYQNIGSATVIFLYLYNIIKSTTFIEHPRADASKLPVIQVSSITKVVQETCKIFSP